MSAEVLRRAASLIRERATAAEATGAWEWRAQDGTTWWAEGTRAGRYIQAMSPAVALAVANWLDDEAEWIEAGSTADGPGLDLARAYLGEAS